MAAEGIAADLDRLDFLDAFRFIPLESRNTPREITRLFRTIIREYDEISSVSTAFHLVLRSDDRPLPRRYHFQPPEYLEADDIDLVQIPVTRSGGTYYALLPNGRIHWIRVGSQRTGIYDLPSLAKEFVYTGIAVTGGSIIVAWEESHFTDVGSAGIFVTEMPDSE